MGLPFLSAAWSTNASPGPRMVLGPPQRFSTASLRLLPTQGAQISTMSLRERSTTATGHGITNMKTTGITAPPIMAPGSLLKGRSCRRHSLSSQPLLLHPLLLLTNSLHPQFSLHPLSSLHPNRDPLGSPFVPVGLPLEEGLERGQGGE